MGYFNEFPHTRMYDGDLGYLIKMYKQLCGFYSNINDILTNRIEEILNGYLKDGLLFIDAVYNPENEDLSFIFKKVGENDYAGYFFFNNSK